MNKNNILALAAGLLVGLIIGFWGANTLNKTGAGLVSPAGSAAPGVPGVPGGQPANGQTPGQMIADVQERIDKARKNPKDLEAQNEAGDMYFQIQRFDEALEFYSKAAEIKPDDKDVQANLAKVYFEKKDFAKSGEHFAKALSFDEKNVDLRSDLGLTFYLRQPSDLNRAVAEFRKGLAINPAHEASLQNLAVALNDLGQKEEVTKTLDLLKNVNPDNPTIARLSGK